MEDTRQISHTIRQWARMAIAQHGPGVLDTARTQQQVFLKEGNQRLVEACQDLIDAMQLELPLNP